MLDLSSTASAALHCQYVFASSKIPRDLQSIGPRALAWMGGGGLSALDGLREILVFNFNCNMFLSDRPLLNSN